MDIWSSRYTWDNGPLPTEGQTVVVPEYETLLLDMDTPILKLLHIKGKWMMYNVVCTHTSHTYLP